MVQYSISSYAAPIKPTGKWFKIMVFDSSLGSDNAALEFLINAPVLAFSTVSNFKTTSSSVNSSSQTGI